MVAVARLMAVSSLQHSCWRSIAVLDFSLPKRNLDDLPQSVGGLQRQLPTPPKHLRATCRQIQSFSRKRE
jgi:hypothetical protein